LKKTFSSCPHFFSFSGAPARIHGEKPQKLEAERVISAPRLFFELFERVQIF
jgi:hypothetical protein